MQYLLILNEEKLNKTEFYILLFQLPLYFEYFHNILKSRNSLLWHSVRHSLPVSEAMCLEGWRQESAVDLPAGGAWPWKERSPRCRPRFYTRTRVWGAGCPSWTPAVVEKVYFIPWFWVAAMADWPVVAAGVTTEVLLWKHHLQLENIWSFGEFRC